MRAMLFNRQVTAGEISLLERRYRGEAPLKTLLALYRGDWLNLILAVVYFVIKHSGVWAMPLVTAQIVDLLSTETPDALHDIAVQIGVLILIFAQNLPMNYLFVRHLSTATRNMEAKLRGAMARRLQYLSLNVTTQPWGEGEE